MMRHCDGKDPNLTNGGKPCDCGLEFDDVDHFVTYPHQRIPTYEEKEAAFKTVFEGNHS